MDWIFRRLRRKYTVRILRDIYDNQCRFADDIGVPLYRPTVHEVVRHWARICPEWMTAGEHEIAALVRMVRR